MDGHESLYVSLQGEGEAEHAPDKSQDNSNQPRPTAKRMQRTSGWAAWAVSIRAPSRNTYGTPY